MGGLGEVGWSWVGARRWDEGGGGRSHQGDSGNGEGGNSETKGQVGASSHGLGVLHSLSSAWICGFRPVFLSDRQITFIIYWHSIVLDINLM